MYAPIFISSSPRVVFVNPGFALRNLRVIGACANFASKQALRRNNKDYHYHHTTKYPF